MKIKIGLKMQDQKNLLNMFQSLNLKSKKKNKAIETLWMERK